MADSNDWSVADRQFMAEAINLASQGLYTTSPNPRVGCVLVQGDSVVGRGWHQFAGEAHAEVNAISSAGTLAKGATAYVSLEPCNLVGRTGACTEALIEAGVGRVVAAMLDPNPRVSGGGIKRLRDAGVDASAGLMANEAAALNPGFVQRMQSNKPWVTCKMAMSIDGRTAMASGESQWVTGPAARKYVQQLRARSCAIVTGVGTVIADNPQLNLRAAELGVAVQRQPALVVVDSQLRSPVDAQIFSADHLASRQVMVACLEGADAARSQALQDKGVEVLEVPAESDGISSGVNLAALLTRLAERECNEVLLEAGAQLAGGFLQGELIDELKLFLAPKIMGSDAMPAFDLALQKMQQAIDLDITDVTAVGNDWLFTARRGS